MWRGPGVVTGSPIHLHLSLGMVVLALKVYRVAYRMSHAGPTLDVGTSTVGTYAGADDARHVLCTPARRPVRYLDQRHRIGCQPTSQASSCCLALRQQWPLGTDRGRRAPTMIQVVLRLIDVHTAAATVQHFAPRYGVLHRM
jgi:hypothetical protein